jgi:hypothetical protein
MNGGRGMAGYKPMRWSKSAKLMPTARTWMGTAPGAGHGCGATRKIQEGRTVERPWRASQDSLGLSSGFPRQKLEEAMMMHPITARFVI